MTRLPVSKLVRNEQAKLSAAYVNSVAIAIFAAGVLAPVVSAVAGSLSTGAPQLGGIATCCLTASGGLHYLARRMLRGLVE